MQRWAVGVGTVLLGVLLLTLAVPRSAAHWLLLPGNAALERIRAGEALTPEGYERILRSREAALGWVELPQARIDLGEMRYLVAQRADVTGADPEDSLVQARRQLELGLAGAPADPRRWLMLADINSALGDPGRAAEALRLSLLSAPNDANLPAVRAGMAFGLWDRLPADAREMAARDAREALAGPEAAAFVREAAGRDREGPLREAVAGDAALRRKADDILTRIAIENDEETSPVRRPAIAAATAAALASSSPLAAMTAQEFLAAVENRQDASLARYLEGFGDALYDFNDVMREAGVTVFCPVGRARPLVGSELQRRVSADLARKRDTEADFAAYAQRTSLGLVALEALAAAHPCDDEGEAAGDAAGAAPPAAAQP